MHRVLGNGGVQDLSEGIHTELGSRGSAGVGGRRRVNRNEWEMVVGTHPRQDRPDRRHSRNQESSLQYLLVRHPPRHRRVEYE